MTQSFQSHPSDAKTSSSEKQDSLDLTPMVDVTFLLLIFFMVTASFALHAAIEQPPAVGQAGPDEVQPVDNRIQVAIDQHNLFYVSISGQQDVEAPSTDELRAIVTDAVNDFDASSMTILAHVDSTHSRVVAAWDAGTTSGIETMQIQTTVEDF